MIGEVIKLDRKFPLVRCENGSEFRCEEVASIKKKGDKRCIIGDRVELRPPESHEFGVIDKILPRETALIRKDPADRSSSQVLAANFTQVVIVEPCDRLNVKRVERELVLAHETGAKVAVLLTKSDKVDQETLRSLVKTVLDLAGQGVKVEGVTIDRPESILDLKDTVFLDETSILLGQSGAGKSSLINMILGRDEQETGAVRSTDGKGRHTTVSRSIIDLPAPEGHFCRIVDMPGVRGVGLWDARNGIEHAFNDIVETAQCCKFRDCRHEKEPGCAVREAVQNGAISQARLDSFLELRKEVDDALARSERSSWKNK